MVGPEPVYSWTNYVKMDYIPAVLYDKFDHIIQVKMANRGWWGRGGGGGGKFC